MVGGKGTVIKFIRNSLYTLPCSSYSYTLTIRLEPLLLTHSFGHIQEKGEKGVRKDSYADVDGFSPKEEYTYTMFSLYRNRDEENFKLEFSPLAYQDLALFYVHTQNFLAKIPWI